MPAHGTKALGEYPIVELHIDGLAMDMVVECMEADGKRSWHDTGIRFDGSLGLFTAAWYGIMKNRREAFRLIMQMMLLE